MLDMDITDITLIAFSSAIVAVSTAVILLNCRRAQFCKKVEPRVDPNVIEPVAQDWVKTKNIVAV